MPNKTLQSYEELGKIGEGGFGQVFKVRSKGNNKIYARKQIHWGAMVPKMRKILRDEVRLLLTIKHPNLVEYKEAVDDAKNETLHIYMEYCAFGDLKQYIHRAAQDKKLIPEEKLWSILEQLVMALFRCHNGYNHHRDLAGTHGSILYGDGFRFYHRDLKPDNIFIGGSACSIKLGDFGLCGLLEPGERIRSTFVGTYPYMSPELLNNKTYSEKSEIWGLGCILHELATQDVTFSPKGTDNSEIYGLISTGWYPPIPESYSNDLQKIIQACFILDPEKRPGMQDIANHPCVVKARGERQLRMEQKKWDGTFSQKLRALEAQHQASITELQKHKMLINFQEESLRAQQARMDRLEVTMRQNEETQHKNGTEVLSKAWEILSSRLKDKKGRLVRREKRLKRRETLLSLSQVEPATELDEIRYQLLRQKISSRPQVTPDAAVFKEPGKMGKVIGVDKKKEEFGKGEELVKDMEEEVEGYETEVGYSGGDDPEWGPMRTKVSSE